MKLIKRLTRFLDTISAHKDECYSYKMQWTVKTETNKAISLTTVLKQYNI